MYVVIQSLVTQQQQLLEVALLCCHLTYALLQLQMSAIQQKLSEQEQLTVQQQSERGEQEAKLQQEVGAKHLLLKVKGTVQPFHAVS